MIDSSPRRSSLGHITSPFPHILNVSLRQNGPFFHPRNPSPNSSLGKTNHSHNIHENNFIRIPTCSKFRTYFFSISYTIVGLSRTKNKIELAYIAISSCASDVFSQVMSLAKWLNMPSNGVCQVTDWKRLSILVNWCDGEVRAWKSDESSWSSVPKWSIRQAGSSKFENLWLRRVNF